MSPTVDASHSAAKGRAGDRRAPGMGRCPEDTQAASCQEQSSHLQNTLPNKIVRYVPAICS